MRAASEQRKSAGRIILASASPRRLELLRQIGIEPEQHVCTVDESHQPGETPEGYVARIAVRKAEYAAATMAELNPVGDYIITADTTVVFDGKPLGKPADFNAAVATWRRLSGQQHSVLTHVALWHNRQISSALCSSAVYFGQIPEASFRQYWDHGEPADKAGGYAIQGLAAAWIERIEGSYSGIMGLPLFETRALLLKAGYNELL